MVCMEFDIFHQDEDARVVPVFKMLFRIEIARSEFTYVNAMNKVIELNDEYKFDWIAIDRGYGNKQLAYRNATIYLDRKYDKLCNLFAVIGKTPLNAYNNNNGIKLERSQTQSES